ncbi:MAG TPA: thiamine-phosphate kinase [Acidobacteriaceae bacterium]|nr:thiamine-phosphate kinase [Acidobacteriaceae bacterium]
MRQPSINGERAFILSLRKRLARSGGESSRASQGRRDVKARLSSLITVGIGDDCAILRPPSANEVLVTTDFTLETVHFRREWHTPESVGHRCLARGLSDLAAMGAKPLAAFLSLALPVELARSRAEQPSWRERFFDGFLSLANKYGVPLAGGDTAESPLMAALPRQKITGLALMDIVLVGTTPRGQALRRSTAKVGDRIYVTGFLGGAAAELARLSASPRQFRSATATTGEPGMPNPHPHLFPEPRLAVGAWLLKNRRASSAIDISDGMSTDLDHLCEESSLAATIDVSAIPIHPTALRVAGLDRDKVLQFALHGGEDYELLFTSSLNVHVPRRIAGVPITCIGEMRVGRSKVPRVVLMETLEGRKWRRPLPPGGWEHFT